MRRFVTILTLLAIPLAFGQVTLRGASASGTMTLVYHKSRSNGSIVELATWTTEKSHLKTAQSTYREDGTPIRRVVTTQGRSVEAVIDDKGATVTTTTRNSSRTTRIPLRRKIGMVDPTAGWFLIATPKAGASATFMSFNPERMYWEQVTVAFEGRREMEIQIANQPKRFVNIVTRRSATSTIRMQLDDKGQPVVWDENRITLTRD